MKQRARAAPGGGGGIGPSDRLWRGRGPEQHARVGAVQGSGRSGRGERVVQVVSGRWVMALEALPAPKEAAVVEHVLGGGVQAPVVALAGVSWLAGDLDEAVIEGEVVADAILPGGELAAVIREAATDEGTDAAEREALVRALQNGHGDERDVRVGGLRRLRGVSRGCCRPRRNPELGAEFGRVAWAAAALGALSGKRASAPPRLLRLRLVQRLWEPLTSLGFLIFLLLFIFPFSQDIDLTVFPIGAPETARRCGAKALSSRQVHGGAGSADAVEAAAAPPGSGLEACVECSKKRRRSRSPL